MSGASSLDEGRESFGPFSSGVFRSVAFGLGDTGGIGTRGDGVGVVLGAEAARRLLSSREVTTS